ncbi:hypothetical protein KBI23_12875 [bacterium]|nr:hypothetical protein [bacterium]MBP9810227.1 hypothetical protein [bacterium]
MSNSKYSRLVALGKLWANIELFHPFLAYKNLAWDSALASAIPMVEAAQSNRDYLDAVNFMLSHLGDQSTYALESSLCLEPLSPAKERAMETLLTYTDDGIAVFDLKNYSSSQYCDLKEAFFRDLDELHKLTKTTKSRKLEKSGSHKPPAIVFDLRRDQNYQWANLDALFEEQFADIFCIEDTVASTIRTRMHLGLAPETLKEPGRYISAFLARDAVRFQASSKPLKIPVIFLINWRTNLPPLLHSLQSQSNMYIASEGWLSEGPAETASFNLPGDLLVSIRLSETISPHGTIDIKADKVITVDESETETETETEDPVLLAALVWARGTRRKAKAHEPASGRLTDSWRYGPEEYPSKELRLLAAFRIWAMVAYFFPYIELLDNDWNQILVDMIPEFEQASNAEEYHLTVAKMVSQLHDTHAVLSSETLSNYFGIASPPVRCRMIEDKVVITEILAEKETLLKKGNAVTIGDLIKIGDIVTAIDGVDIKEKFRELSQYHSASTQASLEHVVLQCILDGPESIASLGIETGGKTKLINLARKIKYKGADATKNINTDLNTDVSTGEIAPIAERKDITLEEATRFIDTSKSKKASATSGTADTYDTIGYVDLTKLTREMIEAMFSKFKETKAIIFDMRGYPKLTGNAISERLAQKNSFAIAKVSRPMVLEPSEICQSSETSKDRTVGEGLGWKIRQTEKQYQTSIELIRKSNDWIYQGKTVLLIDERAMSQAETLAMSFKAANGTVLIGAPTAGANGTVTDFSVPGSIRIFLSGEKYELADNTQLQRVGLQPDIAIKPTIEGIRSGRDEVLEKAIEYLSSLEVSCP